MKKIKVLEVEKVEPEVLSSAIIRISDGMDYLLKSGLTKRAVCVLVKDACGQPLHVTESVLDALVDLRRRYTVEVKKK